MTLGLVVGTSSIRWLVLLSAFEVDIHVRRGYIILTIGFIYKAGMHCSFQLLSLGTLT